MQAKDVMTKQVVTAGVDTPVAELAQQLVRHRVSAVPIVDADGRLIGIVSEGDLMRRPETGGARHRSWWLAMFAVPEERAREYIKAHGGSARDVMTRDVVTVTEDASLEEIAALLEEHRIKRVPVIREGRLIGIVSRADLLHGIVARQHAILPSADDRLLRERVDDAIKATGAESEFVSVVVSGGIAHLWGATYSAAEREAIRIAASNVPGVKAVEANLSVLPKNVEGMWE
jgi:CBS domain-containing protein